LIYVERPLWRLPPAGTKRLSRRLARLGFHTVELGDSAGFPFYVGRLGDGVATPE
jgi:hypothetical protein